MARQPMWEPVFAAGAARTTETEDLPSHPRSAVTGGRAPAFVPYVRREADDERCALEAARMLAAIRAKLPPEWHAWHAARPPVGLSEMGVRELAWARFWREAV